MSLNFKQCIGIFIVIYFAIIKPRVSVESSAQWSWRRIVQLFLFNCDKANRLYNLISINPKNALCRPLWVRQVFSFLLLHPVVAVRDLTRRKIMEWYHTGSALKGRGVLATAKSVRLSVCPSVLGIQSISPCCVHFFTVNEGDQSPGFMLKICVFQ